MWEHGGETTILSTCIRDLARQSDIVAMTSARTYKTSPVRREVEFSIRSVDILNQSASMVLVNQLFEKGAKADSERVCQQWLTRIERPRALP